MSDTHRHYLRDLGFELRDRALESVQAVPLAAPGEERDFALGRKFAYYEVISLMQQQADGFQIPLSDLCLENIDADRDLI